MLIPYCVADGIIANAINAADTCPPVVHKTCGSNCQNSCEHPDAESRPCDQVPNRI